jgi:hypothetical protein
MRQTMVVNSLIVWHAVSPMSDLLVDRSTHIQEEQEPSAKLCLDIREDRIHNELGIKAFGYVISVLDLRLPPKVGDDLPRLGISFVDVSRNFCVGNPVAFTVDDEVTDSLSFHLIGDPEVVTVPKPNLPLQYLEVHNFPVRASTKSTMQ